MMMDKGLSTCEAESFVESAGDFTDFVKLAFGTGIFAKNIEAKIQIYRQANIRVHFGGTLFEAFIVRNQFDEFRRFLDHYKMEVVEVSDGSMAIPHDRKLEYIRILSGQATVLSEVGSKMQGVVIPDELSVIGFDDLPVAAWVGPPLTTVRQPTADMAEQATRLALRLRGAPSQDHLRIDLETRLVVRGSTGAPAVTAASGTGG